MLRKKLVRITDYFFGLPDAKVTLALLIGLSILSPIALYNSFSQATLMKGLLLFAIPGILISYILSLLEPKIPLKRPLFLSCVGTLIYLAAYYLSYTVGLNVMLFAGFAASFVLWHLVSRLFFCLDDKKSFVAASFQFICYAIPANLFGILATPAVPQALASSLVSAVALCLLAEVTGGPFRKAFGISIIEGVSQFFGQWLYGSQELDRAFEKLGTSVESIIGVFRFRTKTQNILLVSPGVHFGPFGTLGGSRFSSMLAAALKKSKNDIVAVFHGTAGHELNPVSESEFSNLRSACEHAINSIKLSQAKGSFSKSNAGDEAAYSLVSNECAFLTLTRAPLSTEDIDYTLGSLLRQIALNSCKNAMVADAHNAETAEFEPVLPGSQIALNYSNAITSALKKLPHSEKLLAGASAAQPDDDSICGGGVNLLLFAAGKSAFAQLVFDANGIVPEFRERLVALLQERAKRSFSGDIFCDVYTTDTHEKNVKKGVVNALGAGNCESTGKLETLALKLFDEALANLSEAESGMAVETFTFKAIGKENMERMMLAISTSLTYVTILGASILVALVLGLVALSVI